MSSDRELDEEKLEELLDYVRQCCLEANKKFADYFESISDKVGLQEVDVEATVKAAEAQVRGAVASGMTRLPPGWKLPLVFRHQAG
jgi:hypothetical protein